MPALLFFLFISFYGCEKNYSKDPVNFFKSLHRKIYKSIEIANKSNLYDELSKIFTEKELEKHFDKFSNFQSYAYKEGLKVSIDDIEYIKVKIKNNKIQARWIVRGKLFHRGHVHNRSLEYQSTYSLTKENGSWKISNSEVKEHEDFSLTQKEKEIATK